MIQCSADFREAKMPNFRVLNMSVRVIANLSMFSSILLTTMAFITAASPNINRPRTYNFLWDNLSEILEQYDQNFDAIICLFVMIIYFVLFGIVSFALMLSVLAMHRLWARPWLYFMLTAISFFIFCYYKMLTNDDYPRDTNMIATGALTIGFTLIPWFFVFFVTQVLWPKYHAKPKKDFINLRFEVEEYMKFNKV